jgi:uncharacterized protein YecE (DUF72 family)
MPAQIRIGTAGWSIPKQHAHAFAAEGSHLARYASRLPAVEINSSFYRPHRPATYARWAATVPPGFRFAAKFPREITHKRRLLDADEPLRQFLGEVEALGPSIGPLLLQLPPSLHHDAAAERFCGELRELFAGQLVCEPRHPSWFTNKVEAQLASLRIARAAADPAVVPRAAVPGGWQGLIYLRLHGSPKVYYSPYDAAALAAAAHQLRDAPKDAVERWCIFDNTAEGEATRNALELLDEV